MRKLLLALLLFALPVYAQPVAIIVGQTPTIGGTANDCLKITSPAGRVTSGACSSGSVTTFSAGTTGLTPSSATAGAVTLAGVLVGANGGTGVANTGKTITLGGNLVTSGAFNLTLVVPATGSYTLPAAGNLVNDAVVTLGSLTTAAGGAFGSNAFNSVAYLPLAGGTLTGPLGTASGADSRAGNRVMTAGTVDVANTTVTANTVVMLSRKDIIGTAGVLTYTLNAGVGFTINSDNVADESTISFWLIEVP